MIWFRLMQVIGIIGIGASVVWTLHELNKDRQR